MRAFRRATYADVEALPRHQVGEIIAGELHVSPRPSGPHAVAESALMGLLSGYGREGGGGGGDAPGGWWILVEPELHLDDDILVPDLAGWRRERMPRITRDMKFFTLAPDWVCEVLSPSTARVDRGLKLPLYARRRVQHVWIVDPLARVLEAYRLDGVGERYVLAASCEGFAPRHVEPFGFVALDFERVWLPDEDK